MIMLKKLGQTVAAVAVAASFSLPAAALTVDFTKAATSSNGGSKFGNSLTFGSMTASAYANTGANGTLEAAQLLQWNTGLGVCNRLSRRTVAQHGIIRLIILDPSIDLVAFFFDKTVNFDSVTISPYGKYDRDISYWVGTCRKRLQSVWKHLCIAGRYRASVVKLTAIQLSAAMHGLSI